jgi:SAM-dependent methyltransferase
MDGYDEGAYGRIWADVYDEIFVGADDEMIDLLARHSGSPPRALELAVGTGRVALALAERGVEVSGIDISEEMVARMRGKPGGEAIPVTIGNFRDVPVEESFPLIYLPFNTLFGLLTQDAQIDCFRNVAAHLEPGGRFILDCFVPDLTRFDDHNTRMAVSSIRSVEEHTYEMSIYQPTTQRISNHLVRRFADGSTRVLPVEVRFAWPSEIDLMARLAGLELEDRFGWYDLRPFNDESKTHMSIYRKPA